MRRAKAQGVYADMPIETGTKPKQVKPFIAKFIGKLPVMKRLDLYKPNDWNPNEMLPEERKALRETLKSVGWAMSQAMLVWATDEKGRKKNVVIDGEHRCDEARKLGFVEGPVVELRGITRAEAISWTLRIDKIRGRFNDRKVARVLDTEFGLFAGKEQETLSVALRLGFSPDDLDGLRLKLGDIAGAGAKAAGGVVVANDREESGKHKCPRCSHEF